MRCGAANELLSLVFMRAGSWRMAQASPADHKSISSRNDLMRYRIWWRQRIAAWSDVSQNTNYYRSA